MSISPTDQVTIALEAQQWNTIIEILHSAPYRVAAPLISAIVEQGRTAQPRASVVEGHRNDVLDRAAWGKDTQ